MDEKDSIRKNEKSEDKSVAGDKPTSGPGSAMSGTEGSAGSIGGTASPKGSASGTMAGSGYEHGQRGFQGATGGTGGTSGAYGGESGPLHSSTHQGNGHPAGHVAEAKNMAGQIFGDVRNAAEQMLEERKARAADQVHGVAQALRRTAEGVKGENDLVGRYAEQAADTVERFADTFRERRIGDLVAELDGFARRSPTLFLLGAVAAGFVVGRFMAASGERKQESGYEYRDEPRRGRSAQRTQTAGYGANGNYSGTRGNA
jgi:hypothetical protein